MIEPYEMAEIYWRYMKSMSIKELESFLGKISLLGQAYWSEVLEHLKNRKVGKGKGRLN